MNLKLIFGSGLAWLGLCAMALYVLKHVRYPFLVIGISFFSFFAVLTFLSKSKFRIFFWNMAFIFLILIGFESFYAFSAYRASKVSPPAAAESSSAPAKAPAPATHTLGTYANDGLYFKDDLFLGYRPKAGMIATSKRLYGEETVYDVVYSIGPDQLRVTNSGLPIQPHSPCVLFFGDSFMFGEGINDNETIPFRFEQESGGRYKAFNFGFHGYGPQQMLLWLETAREQSIVGTHSPKAAVYIAIPDHINRAAGRAEWDFMGPRYALRKGQLVRQHRDMLAFAWAKASRRLSKSYLISRLIPVFKRPLLADEAYDRELYIRMVLQSKALLKERYQSPLIVIWWWEKKRSDESIIRDQWIQAGVRIIPIENIIPDIWERTGDYTLKNDGHPNARANRLIGRFLANDLKLGGAVVNVEEKRLQQEFKTNEKR